MENMLKGDRINFASVLFIQLDRINHLFSEIEIFTERGYVVNANTSRAFAAIKSLDLMMRYKLSEEERKKFENELKEKEINKVTITSHGLQITDCISYLDIVMKYIFKTNLLPKERVTYETEVN